VKSATTREFWRRYRELADRGIQKAAQAAYRKFQKDPSHPSLRFHRLEGYPDVWSVRVTRDIRAVGLLEGDTVTWFWIGNHKDFDQQYGS
jgi:hypothetical protein